jgi:hypothetical protein
MSLDKTPVRIASPSSGGAARSTAGSNDDEAVRALRRERDPDLLQLERERGIPMPAEIKLPRAYARLVTEPLEEAWASALARRHILELGKRR